MSKTFTDLARHALNGATMGTRWSALFFAAAGLEPGPVQAALQAAVSEVDMQMSGWRADSDLIRLNQAPCGQWIDVPPHLIAVLRLGLAIGKASEGAFEMGMGDAVSAWGFGPAAATGEGIRRAMDVRRAPGWECLDIRDGQVLKRQPMTLDLNGIAKGYGVDRLAATLADFGITAFLVGIDGEMRAAGLRPDGEPWTIAVEQPDHGRRAVHSVLALEDAAVATSGDYRHWVDIGGRRLSHTFDPHRGAPLLASPASITVVARSCAEADAWATALMVLGVEKGAALAARQGLEALFLLRGPNGEVSSRGTGRLFGGAGAGMPAVSLAELHRTSA